MHELRPTRFVSLLLLGFALLTHVSHAQENPYFVTYDHHMEETGNLEISSQSTFGLQKQHLPTFYAPLLEMEYGWNGWWTSELYLESAAQSGNAVFTGWRLENRFKPLKREHWLNPLLYFEFEDTNEASRIRKEIVGNAEVTDEPLTDLRHEKAREFEGKLILSSNVRSWNISENFIVEKNTTEPEPTEFGYAFAVSRPLATLASGRECSFCLENFRTGVELYGGLGTTDSFGLWHTAHYAAPGLVWQINSANSVKVSAGFGLTPLSERMLLRFGYTYEIAGFGSRMKQAFAHKKD